MESQPPSKDPKPQIQLAKKCEDVGEPAERTKEEAKEVKENIK